MTLPRRLTLSRAGDTVQLRQDPVLPHGRVLDDVHNEPIATQPFRALDLPVAAAVDIELDMQAGDVAHLTLSGADGSSLRISVDATTGRCNVDRTNAGTVDPSFPSRQTATAAIADDHVHLRLILDASSVETFLGDGATVLTNQVVIAHPWTLTVSAVDGTPELAHLRITDLARQELSA